jgi:preprotein translocase subunit SecG
MPFGATSHPRTKEPKTFLQKYLWLIVIFAIIVILLIALALISRKKK